MLDYWGRLGLVQVRKIDGSLVKSMQRASTHEEWKSRGIKLFWEKNYDTTALCFKKAGEETWEKRAKTSRLRADMRFREAAEIFYSIKFFEAALECFCDSGDYERTGRIYLEKFSEPELRKTGECFSLARNYTTAAEVYAKGNFFRECLPTCNKGNHFDMGLQYINKWKKHASFNGVFTASIQAKFTWAKQAQMKLEKLKEEGKPIPKSMEEVYCGQGSTYDKNSPTCVSSLLRNWNQERRQPWHIICISVDGDVYAFGSSNINVRVC